MTDGVTIRRARRQDAAATSALIRRTLLTTNAADYDPEILQGLAAWYSPARVAARGRRLTLLVAVRGETIVGTVARSDDHLEGFFVEPDLQCSGIGSRLLEAIEADARSAGLDVARLEASVTAERFYLNRGYTHDGEPYEGTFGRCIPMSRAL